MRTWKGIVAVMTLAPLGFVSTPATAQESPAPEQMTACTAQVEPGEIQAGQKALRVAITLSSAVGEVSAFDTQQEDAGVVLAQESDLPKATDMAREDQEQPKPIEMASTGNLLTLWLSTEHAQPGAYPFTLKGADGECTGSITVTESH